LPLGEAEASLPECEAAATNAGATAVTSAQEALRGLADENDMVAAEGLGVVAGFDGSVAAALEQQLGPAPWHVSQLEALLEALLGCSLGTSSSAVAENRAEAEVAPAAPGASPAQPPAPSPTKKRRRRAAAARGWRSTGLEQFEEALDAELRADERSASGRRRSTGGDLLRLEEEEGEEEVEVAAAAGAEAAAAPPEHEVAEGGLCQLQRSVLRDLVAPLLEGPWTAEEEPALQELPSLVEELVALLRKTWRLAHARGHSQACLARELQSARAEAATQRERAARAEAAQAKAEAEAASRGEEAQEFLELTSARLAAARQTLRERETKLAEARQRSDQLEQEAVSQAQRIQQLEARIARGDAERRAALAPPSPEARRGNPGDVAAQGEGGGEASPEAEKQAVVWRRQSEVLQRRLSASQQELEAARDELGVAVLKNEEARSLSERRAAELESRLAETQQLAEQHFKARLAVAAGSEGPEAGCADAGAGSPAPERGLACSPLPCGSSLAGKHALAALSEELEAQSKDKKHVSERHRRRRSSDLSVEKGAGISATEGKAATPPVAMPADLRSLGRLLTGGGGFFGRKGPGDVRNGRRPTA